MAPIQTYTKAQTDTALAGKANTSHTHAESDVTGLVADLAAKANLSGSVVQVKNTQTGAVATGTTTIPFDDTIPQNTEGTQFMSLSITPTSATSKLKIDVVLHANVASQDWVIVALFQDSAANALAALPFYASANGGGSSSGPVKFTHYMTAGTTSATTFKVRAGPGLANTLTFNGVGGSRFLGGVIASSITITEIAA